MTDGLFHTAVVGGGLIGSRRAHSLASMPGVVVDAVCEPAPERGERLAAQVAQAQQSPCRWFPSHTAMLVERSPAFVAVAVPHDHVTHVVLEVLNRGIDTLVEKPMGLNLEEAHEIAAAVEPGSSRLAVGFNYRHYPGIVRAIERLSHGDIGRLMFVRMSLGHAGRPDYEREWKAMRAHAGGGALFDPGIHLIDLARYFAGELTAKQATISRVFWPTDVEDVALAVLHGADGLPISIQASIVEWRNQFSVHLFGELGYLKIDGRMGTYGMQTLTFGERWAWLKGVSQSDSEEIESFGDDDTSFETELRQVVEAFRTGGPLPADHRDGLAAMRLISDLYDLAG